MRAVLVLRRHRAQRRPRRGRRGLAECRRFLRRQPPPAGARRGRRSTPRSPSRTRRSREAGALCRELGTVLHVHLAEDGADVADARAARLAGARSSGSSTSARCPPARSSPTACTSTPSRCAKADDAGCWLVQNPRSNRGNRVGYPARARREPRGSRSAPTATRPTSSRRPRRCARRPRATGEPRERATPPCRAAPARSPPSASATPSRRLPPAARPTSPPRRRAPAAPPRRGRPARGRERRAAHRRHRGDPRGGRAPRRRASGRMGALTRSAGEARASSSRTSPPGAPAGLNRHSAHMATLGLETDGRRPRRSTPTASAASATRASCCRPSPSSPTRRGSRPDPRARSARVDPDAPHPLNLFRVHWYNDAVDAAASPTCPSTSCCRASLTGVDGADRRRARQPLPDDPRAQGARRLRLPRAAHRHRPVRPDRHRAVWPSTGNYCRGGVAISRIIGCRGVAVLPEGMSRERFALARALGRRPGGHRAHAGLREQRQGDLRRVRRARRATRRTSSSTSSASSGTTSSTTPAPAAALGDVFETLAARGGRRCACAPSSRRPARPARSPPATT